jgi:zinc and cadmium transporter
LLATTLAGVVSITAAAVFSFTLLSKVVERMVSLSVGIMLSTSLLHALPEAFESQASARSLFATLLAGLLAFFLLEKLAILRHSHHHEGDGHHHHARPRQARGRQGRLDDPGRRRHAQLHRRHPDRGGLPGQSGAWAW